MSQPLRIGLRGATCLLAASALLGACRRTADPAQPAAGSATPLARVDFNQHIQPVLSEYCYQCHGPDPGGRKAGLRLDRAPDAYAGGTNGPAIRPGQPDQSPALQRMLSHDPDQVMPPPDLHKTIPAEDIARVRQWIAEGAVYQDHWAFIPPVRPTPPTVAGVSDPVDAFIRARLQRASLAPSPEADRRTLIRRVTLDLTGLLPTPAEVEAFVNDPASNAYDTVVDRLLASPRYGEHRARYWLDYVRYADTHGIHFDNYRSIWPYRDYVIRAFNANQPYDQFVREQLAGDLLTATNLDALVATGYLRCNQTSNEGGGIPEEFLANNTRDRVEAYGSAFLGLTVGCAGCHDHKFDPMTARDFYQLAAYFSNTAEPAWDFNNASPAPVLRLPADDQRAAADALLARRTAAAARLQARRTEFLRDPAARLAATPPQAVATTGLIVRLRLDEGRGEEVANSAPGANPATYRTTNTPPLWGEDWVHGSALRMELSTRLELGDLGNFEKDQPYSLGGWFQCRTEPGNSGDGEGSLLARMDAPAQGYRGWDILYAAETFHTHLIANWSGDALKVSATDKYPRGRWHHVFVTYDGSGKAAGLRLYVNGEAVATKVENDTLKGSTRTPVPTQLGRRAAGDEMRQARYQDIRIYTRTLTPEEVARLPYEDLAAEWAMRDPATWTPDQRHTVLTWYLDRVDAEAAAARKEIAAADAELTALTAKGPTSLIAVERDRQPASYILARGVHSARGERVFPATPHFLPGASNPAPNRLALANWTLSATNPLTSRVAVNRIWQELFGAGLVDTPDDFGVMGARPTHPELLDWLAVEFRESGWDIKALYRRLVRSATYRQSSVVRPDHRQVDPQNRLLARGPRHRLDAEVLRDVALQAGGLLGDRIGGPSFKGYQPEGLWQAVSMPESDTYRYKADTGDALYRRSLYAFWKRFAPPPALETFDAPAREVACPRRPRTNTPLQALALMNEPQFVESCRKLAERLLREAQEENARYDLLAALLLNRPLADPERAVLQGSRQQFATHYAAHPDQAALLLKVGAAPADTNLPPAEIAAWTLVASQALNLDETISK